MKWYRNPGLVSVRKEMNKKVDLENQYSSLQ